MKIVGKERSIVNLTGLSVTLTSATFLIKGGCQDTGCMGVKTSFLPAFPLT